MGCQHHGALYLGAVTCGNPEKDNTFDNHPYKDCKKIIGICVEASIVFFG